MSRHIRKACMYAVEHYGVPACVGRRVCIAGKAGVIAEDRGHYIGVNFDADKPGVVYNAHPTWKVEYLGIGPVRRMTRSQARYKRYLEYGEGFDSFLDYCKWDSYAFKKGEWVEGAFA